MNPAFKTLLALALVTLAAPAIADKPISEKDRAAIVELLRKHDSTLTANDLDGFFALTTEDYVELPTFAATEDREAARRSLADFLEKNRIEVRSEIGELAVAGNLASLRTTTRQVITPKAGPSALKVEGKNLMILKRQRDGSWRIKVNMWNNNGPLQPVT